MKYPCDNIMSSENKRQYAGFDLHRIKGYGKFRKKH